MAAAAAEGRRGRPQRRRADEEVGAADGGDMEQDGEAEAGDDDEEDENAVSVQLSTDGVDVPLSGSAATEEESTPSSARPKSLFDLPYRMVYAVATLDSVYLYDTQQAGPLAMLGNLHYAPFTDLTWCVLLARRMRVLPSFLPAHVLTERGIALSQVPRR